MGQSFDSGTRSTIAKAWQDAQKLFEEETEGFKLNEARGKSLEDVISQLERRYASSSDGKKRKKNELKDRAKTACLNVINSLQYLSQFAEPMVSAIFEPAGICLKAVSFLLDIPNKINDVFAGFSELFEGVQFFLHQYKILDRIDRVSGLPPELVENTNKLLIAFVRMCALCYKPIRDSRLAKVKIVLGAALANFDQGIHDELKTFERLTKQQDSLTHTATLEHVMYSEGLMVEKFAETNSRMSRIGSDVRANGRQLSVMGDGVKSLVSDRDARKYDDQHSVLLQELANRLGPDIAAVSEQHVNTIREYQRQCVPDSAAWLHHNAEARALYEPWLDFECDDEALLVISGPQSSGKSYLLSTVLAALEEKKASAGLRFAVAYYAFPKSDFRQMSQAAALTREASVIKALKSLAYQVANQVPTYAEKLKDALAAGSAGSTATDTKEGKVLSSDSYQDCWNKLQLSSEDVDLSCVFLLDDIDQISRDERKELVGLLLNQTAHSWGQQIYTRSFVTTTAEAIEEVGVKTRSFEMTSMNSSDVEKFIERELTEDSIFAQGRKRYPDMLESFQKGEISKEHDYSVIRSRLDRVRQAFDELKSEDEIKEIMCRPLDQEHNEVAQEIIEALNTNLSDSDIDELNEILIWVYYLPMSPSGKELEILLGLRGFITEEANLKTKLARQNRYGRLLTSANYNHRPVEIRSQAIRKALERQEDVSTLGDEDDISDGEGNEEPRMSLQISIKNAPREVVRYFIWDLNRKLNLDQSFFTQAEISTQTRMNVRHRLRLRSLASFSIILTQFLELLTDSPRDSTEEIVSWVSTMLPLVLKQALQMEKTRGRRLPKRDEIVKGLLSLLTDVDITVQHLQRCQRPPRWTWLDRHDSNVVLEEWLKGGGDGFDPAESLRPLDRRRLQRLVNSSMRYGYLYELTVAVGHEWLLNDKWDAGRAYDWVDGYLTMIGREIKINEGRGETEEEEEEKTKELQDDQRHEADTVTEGNRYKLSRAVEWVKRELKVGTLGLLSLRRLAETYTKYGLHEDAIDTYLAAIKHGRNIARLRRGLAYAYARDKRFRNAAIQMETVFGAYRNSREESPMDEQELRADHASCARWYEEHTHLSVSERYARSLIHYRDSLDPNALDFERYNNYIEAAWRVNSTEHIEVVHAKIISGCDKLSNSSTYLTEVLLRSKEDKLIVFMDDSIIPLMRQLGTMHLLKGSLQLALRKSTENDEISLWDEKFYEMYVCLASVSLDRSIGNMEECARDLANHSTRLKASIHCGTSIHQWVARLCCQLYFDLAQLNWMRKEWYVSRLERISRQTHQVLERRGFVKVITYLCRHYVQTQRMKEATELLADHIQRTFDDISDDVPRPGDFTYCRLVDYATRLGDDNNALAALYLFLLDQRDAFERYEASKGNQHTDTAEPVAHPYARGKPGYGCDGDCARMELDHTQDVWRCRSCPGVDFCAECYCKLREGRLDKFVCNAAHEFFHRPKLDDAYASRVGPGNVEIGGRIVQPGSWEREGGEVVPVSEWLNRLRDEWGAKRHVKETDGDNGQDES